ncbi:deoxyguanosinetriphosphate triphosphohydrolase family protein [Rhizobium hidalgonense]|uniref:deoxyguanosinetriphosphate triphosphohydrolase family protein n=1 Tax=Rhizobium hidalgonense TaxID=1538159 RepID=UPI002870FFDB|nr:dNTP triphosphohydrolase [Rhizobium hidalgonense]MDR9807959.1 dNTP triphosphohydrolase [Rhizobium hidalgonense]
MNFWSADRRPGPSVPRDRVESAQPGIDDGDAGGWRSEFQHDHDRLLFSTPVRRLSDKTQVWPMDENDGVRTRLTHSHEVANLARSIGSNIATQRPDLFGADLHKVIQPILSAIGLAHDLGNPPFGHQGEAAIGNWFKKRSGWIFDLDGPDGKQLDDIVPHYVRTEFTKFDGNPQTFRLITRLQTHRDYLGLDLTAATLSAALKYPVSANSAVEDHPVFGKCGYFESERDVVNWMRERVGIAEKERHPLTWIMEACDDIAYSILDVDDVMKKKIISPDDVLVILQHDERSKDHPAVEKITRKFKEIHDLKRSPQVARDIKIGMLRAYLISALIEDVAKTFLASSDAVMAKTHAEAILDENLLCDALKDIARQHAFAHPSVLKMEALGAEALDELMSFFWDAISKRKKPDDFDSKRTTAMAKYGWSLVSPNYIEAAKLSQQNTGPSSGVRYRELRLLTDMVSGMTDSFALNLWNEVRSLPK